MLLLGSGATAAETMKNLVLPGIGSFTVVDAAKVSASDLGSNFFVTEEDLGQPRARAVCQWLCEMNEDVSGEWKEVDVDAVIADDATLRAHTLVIGCQLRTSQAVALGDACHRLDLPLLVRGGRHLSPAPPAAHAALVAAAEVLWPHRVTAGAGARAHGR